MIVRKVARPLLATAFVAQGIEMQLATESDGADIRPALNAMRSLPNPIGNRIPNDAESVARVSGAIQTAAGMLLATGRMPRVAAALLAGTAIPANFGSHMYWAETDSLRKAQQRRAFLTDVSLVGALVLAAADTAGKPSLGWRGRRAGRRAAETLLNALPSSDGGPHGGAQLKAGWRRFRADRA
ncbi:putative membrane protein YphA (DoxX/SURF4 family) [Mycobacterium sp. MAA66]|uniref:DoxX family protein n=1 Tax=Mycobacterium sp. MAA66 TaxID=3156297 RepID=UPI00351730A1